MLILNQTWTPKKLDELSTDPVYTDCLIKGGPLSSDYTYAIDFGTTNSLLSFVENKNNKKILDLDNLNEDASILRSIMYYPKEGEPSFGQNAIKKYVDESGEGRFLRSIKKYLPTESFTGTIINNKFYSIEELIGRFLKEMKGRADEITGKDVTRVVLGRPAKFSQDKDKDKLAQNRLENAAKIAGFNKIDFCPEPLAAAYEFKKTVKDEKLLLVVDLGGGTSDFTVIKIHPGDYKSSDVLSIGGVAVAGNILDGCIMGEKIAPYLGSKVKYKFPMSNNILEMPANIKLNLMSPADIVLMSRKDIMKFLQEVKKCTFTDLDQEHLENLFCLISENQGFAIYEEIEKCKREVCLNGDYKFVYEQEGISIRESLNYSEFLAVTKNKIDQIFDELKNVLSMAQVSPEQIDLICCTGGTSKVPEVADRLVEIFGENKIQTFKNFHSVIHGLAERAVQNIS